ncbi:uncharacterized protein SPAPADRAFT_153457 [Spathaspora passalidarum NRRL Y-27907]|uniref:Uncharacterized protein n=1 Tax=Spathaspora passalidarum (strain NRRL Y-27907 / 11-Y1) TaxID=619300 RepID=G3AN92_SPAPN|nr:uncharacterized protein SPAPADRAFT_153457 [Spathaspora passalidarum NRRL Y-27907]EGW32475.1 hypothetical protein SPAPADRAFT_153457 [Spathaspora passalidarum NRRL Y-27907]
MFKIVLVIILLITSVSGVLPDHNEVDRSILKVSTRTHDKHLIIQTLQDVADKITLRPDNSARFQLWNGEDDRTCIEGSSIKYYISKIELTDKNLEASECRINLNANFQAVLEPTPNIHLLFLSNKDAIDTQLKINLLDEFSLYSQFKEYKFNDFGNLNYDLQCVIDYQEIMQVQFKETIIEVTLERKIDVHESCGFNQLNNQFPGYYKDSDIVQLPVNGTFYCHRGKSSTCNRAIAEYKGSRYKLPD